MEPDKAEMPEEGDDYEASPEMAELGAAFARAVKGGDGAAIAKAFCAMSDEYAGAASEPAEKSSKPSLAILLGKGH